MKNTVKIFIGTVLIMVLVSCNHGISSSGSDGDSKNAKPDRSQRTSIDSAEYVDFTGKNYNAKAVRRDDMINALNGNTYKNGNSSIVIKAKEGTITLMSDKGTFNGKVNCQIYGEFIFDIQAASDDCLYIRKDQGKPGYVMIDGAMYRNDAMPDLTVCLPLYGYSRNRIEVSSVMDGYIVMPSGTYWKQ
jgi:hypothetical protein